MKLLMLVLLTLASVEPVMARTYWTKDLLIDSIVLGRVDIALNSKSEAYLPTYGMFLYTDGSDTRLNKSCDLTHRDGVYLLDAPAPFRNHLFSLLFSSHNLKVPVQLETSDIDLCAPASVAGRKVARVTGVRLSSQSLEEER
ncbi:hypothetical protein [Pseudobacteriovorax antillogorgiicola]|uniref:Uncharacterized protein n=1 Tax=Pseudobacteriovorax antillogorgiicola TaxID=1513793 RepID=A0A1Y6C116_9BACT|nr:hypothetical protein [Pseudobacteriovorax antillogorgiicola]TCS50668.1 hypothetical protein EDD56_11250 [Pseudobacteriovorax antillogorgiicola]SMF39962.1 hypothetical protein SAMN06296036_11249 [Pseudobacteriovorax antillogorgiicola]